MANPIYLLPRRPQEIGPFPAGTKPVRSGVYRTRLQKVKPPKIKTYQWFDVETELWSIYMPTAYAARLNAGRVSNYQYPQWWGLDQEAV